MITTAGQGYLITADAYYCSLASAKAMLERKHYFLFSCKANYPFKPHFSSILTKPHKGVFAYLSGKKKLMMYTWVDKKLLNMFTN